MLEEQEGLLQHSTAPSSKKRKQRTKKQRDADQVVEILEPLYKEARDSGAYEAFESFLAKAAGPLE